MSDIVLSHISKVFDGTWVLDDFSAIFPDGEISVIMAPSGKGKTTLLRILEGFEQPDKGTISGLSGRILSAVFQDNCLVQSLSAWKNIQIVNPAMTKQEIFEEMEKLSLGRCREEKAETLSGGEKRRVSLLRALLYPADTYLLDEPFNALDDQRKAEAISYTRKHLSGKTALLVTHSQEESDWMNPARTIRF
jgi:NitT/TauT family transport system ATP-binding protein